MIKAVIFDVGGTYLSGSLVSFARKACKMLGIKKFFRETDLRVFVRKYNQGVISAEECFRKCLGVPITSAQMKRIKSLWTSTYALQPEMARLVKRLKKRYALAVLSNSDPLNSDSFKRKGLYAPFNHVILSHELGVTKPDKKIYRIALKKLKMRPDECVFIDDQKICVDAARKIGMNAILFESVRQLKKALKARGVDFS
ncbi:MAG: HAD family phosphatase [Candidatus Aenigmatarchaeota archaeon]